jgi:hypothetical protein
MMRIPWRAQLGLVALGYVMVLGLSAFLVFIRYLQYVNHPDDVAASSGMWAGGDLMLELFICGMLLVMSFVLILVIRKSETAYTVYSRIVLAISATAPASVGLLAIPAVGEGFSLLGWACLFRVFASPIVLMGLGMSRVFARFPRAKRITNYAVLTEALTLVSMFLMLFLPFHLHQA